MRRWFIVAGLIVALLVAAVMFAHRLFFTPEGLRFAVRQLDRLPAVKVQVIGASGTLAGPLSADRVIVDHEAVHVDVYGVHVQPRLADLLTGAVRLDGLSVDRAEVRIKPRPPQPPSQPHFLPAWLRIVAPDFLLRDIALELAGGTRFGMRQAYGSLRITRWRLDVSPFTLQDAAGQLTGEVYLRASQPLGLRGKVQGHWRLPDEHTYRFVAEARGDLGQLAADVTLQDPARLSFSGTFLQLTDQPHVVGTLRAVDFDGSPWVPADKLPRLSGSLSIVANPRATGFDGTLTSPAVEGGQVRLQGAGTWHDHVLEIGSFRAWLPRTKLELNAGGTVTFGGGPPRLALDGEWTQLRWPLTGPAVVESPQGRYSLQGAMPYAFTTRGVVRGPSIPETAFDAAGSLQKDALTLDRAEGATLSGTVRGSGRLAWSGDQAWQFRVEGKGLDVRKLRPEVQGRVNVAGSVEGKGFGAASPWTARIDSMSGTLFDRALTGRGEIAHRDGTFELRGVRVSNGASHVDVNGRWGRTLDLQWDADLRSLAVVAAGLEGELVSSGSVRGTATKPELTGEAHARKLRYGEVSAATVDATVDVDATDTRASRVEVRAGALVVAGVHLDSVVLRAKGLTHEHDVELAFASPGSPERHITEFRGTIAADGMFDPAAPAWRGNLTRATFTFPDGESRLLQPVALELGPALVRVSPLCLATEESRLCIEGERQASPESWRVIYSAEDWPLRRILRTLLGWHEFDGTLQASGWAEKRPGSAWVGGTTAIVAHPTLDVPRNKFRTERIDLGSGRVDLYAEPESLRAVVDLDVTENTRIRGEATAERRGDILASPLHGTLRGESTALTALPLLVPEIDRSSGSLDAEVTLAGTLGEPRFDGSFHVRDGRFELYRTNLVLSKLTADGTFVGDQLTFEASGETARGKVRLDGRFGWPNGIMTGTMRLQGERLLVADTPEYKVLASPDLTLRAGAEGYQVEGKIDVPVAKISPKDLSSSVGTSADEKIVGTEAQDTGPSTLERVRSRVRVVLGDDVKVESYGLKARLGGDLTVLTRPGDVARGDGVINVVEGQYKAFGQDVKITKGKISYANAPLNEPTLELTAERVIKDADVTVAVNVRGSLAKPFVTITSTPAMSNNEALSYLLTGRSIDTLQSNETASVNKAAENLALSGGGFLLGGIGSKLGLDEVTVERTDTSDTAVTLGKFILPKLFVSYGVSIAEAINTIKLRYTLDERWSLKAEAGLYQSADIEYKIEH